MDTSTLQDLAEMVTELYIRQDAIFSLILNDQIHDAVVDTVIQDAIQKSRAALAARLLQVSGTATPIDASLLASALGCLKESVLLPR